MSEDFNDLAPEHWKVYGYVVASKQDNNCWHVEDSDEYDNLPAYEPFLEVAKDRVSYLRANNIHARVLALLVDDDYDTPERMDEAKKARHDDGETKSNSEPDKD